MKQLEKIRLRNPRIEIQDIHSELFRSYGRVIDNFNPASLIELSERAVSMPEQGSRYYSAIEDLETHPDADFLRNTCFGQTEVQLGICHGRNNRLNALEYHKSSEVDIAVTDLILLLADRRDMEADDRISSRKVKGFYLKRGEAVELFATTLHFCPCEVKDGFSCIVVLPRNTNKPLDPDSRDKQDELLFAKNKWLLAHEYNSPLIEKGAKPGIYGENWNINTIK